MNKREIDAKVAEAMGLEVTGEYMKVVTESGRTIPTRLSHYSTSIEAAWQVVEWLEARGWLWTLRKGDDCIMTFYKPEWVKDRSYISRALPTGHASTPELAICLAFLKAMGVEVDVEAEER